MFARLAANLKTVFAGEVDVQNDQVRLAFKDRRHGIVAVQHDVDFVVVFAQIAGNQRRESIVVLDEQNPEEHFSGNFRQPGVEFVEGLPTAAA